MATVLTTNPQPQNDRLAACLQAEGLQVVQLPLHDYSPPSQGVHGLRERCAAHDGIVIVNTPRSAQVLCEEGVLPVFSRHQVPVYAVGAYTASLLRDAGCELAGEGRSGAVALIEMLAEAVSGQQRVLGIQAERGMRAWQERATDLGMQVDVIATHALVRREIAPEDWHCAASVDAVCFTAPSAVALWRDAAPEFLQRNVRYFPIGETTAEALRSAGYEIDVPPERPAFSEFARHLHRHLATN